MSVNITLNFTMSPDEFNAWLYEALSSNEEIVRNVLSMNEIGLITELDKESIAMKKSEPDGNGATKIVTTNLRESYWKYHEGFIPFVEQKASAHEDPRFTPISICAMTFLSIVFVFLLLHGQPENPVALIFGMMLVLIAVGLLLWSMHATRRADVVFAHKLALMLRRLTKPGDNKNAPE